MFTQPTSKVYRLVVRMPKTPPCQSNFQEDGFQQTIARDLQVLQ